MLSREEVSRLINAAGTLFRRMLLMTLHGTGMRRSELARLKVGDIDSQRMIIRVVAGNGGKDRDLPPSPGKSRNSVSDCVRDRCSSARRSIPGLGTRAWTMATFAQIKCSSRLAPRRSNAASKEAGHSVVREMYAVLSLVDENGNGGIGLECTLGVRRRN